MKASRIPASLRPTDAQVAYARAELAKVGKYGDFYAAGYLASVIRTIACGGRLTTENVAFAMAATDVDR
ncbi:hypothetical protein FMEAI12_4420029 [Parafrankia sp. Ea1.12]|nr:hypothetical protein FMEAI12_4420029 [Parafrankia sp. Ea1.12]